MNSIDDRIKKLSPQQRALLEQRMTAAASEPARPSEPIAIIGVGCRYPGGVHDLASFAALLRSGVDAVGEIPPDRWDVDAHYSPDPGAKGKMVSKRGGFLPDVKSFDADFFGISPREAERMDPQQRLLLEVSYEAFEDAGIPVAALSESATGVYVGITLAEYADRQSADPRSIDVYSGTGSYLNVAAGRISYVYGLQGPCMAVDAACASSLVTVHLACRALRARECGLALAGGVSLMLAPETTIYLSQTGALAPDGRCKTFDARANGYVRAEGCGLLVLKRLSEAVRDRDRIHAVIRGSAVSQDGASSGLTVPNGRAQQKVIRSALEDAAVPAAAVSYVEAHGTGTPLGDPIELTAIAAVYGQRAEDAPLYVGSLKTNFGHAEAAAGVGGILRAVVALEAREIPAHLHFETLNPRIAIDPARVKIPTAPVPWAGAARPRLAGVSSFGFSGVIAHAVLEEGPGAAAVPRAADALRVVPLTAKDPRALDALVGAFRGTVAALDEDRLADLSFTTGRRRTHHAHRAWFAFRTKDELLRQLDAAARGAEVAGAVRGAAGATDDVRVAMVFPGQGSQWVGMGQQLLQQAPVFRDAIHEIDRAMRPWAEFSLLDVLGAAPDAEPFARVAVVQPAIFAIQVALARQWEAWGVRPHAVIGHSMGEVAAACVAGALRLEDAAAVICRRSQLVASTSGQGAMALIELSAAEVEAAIADCGERIAIAAYNGPSTVLVSGEPGAVDEVLAALRARGAFCRRVKVDYASHCAQMDPLLDRIRAELAHVQPQRGRVPIYSTVRGAILDGAQLDGHYWAENLRCPVRFHEQIQALLAGGVEAFLEVSPHPVLAPSIQGAIDGRGGQQIVLGSLRRDEDELQCLAGSLGSLFCRGRAVEVADLCPLSGQLVETPQYPWQRRPYWISAAAAPRRAVSGEHPLIGAAFRPAVGAESYFWEFDLDLGDERFAFIADHRVRGVVVVPGTAYLDLVLAAAGAAAAPQFAIRGVALRDALTLLPGQPKRVQIAFVRDSDGDFTVSVASRDPAAPSSEPWSLHATLRVCSEPASDDGALAENALALPAGATLVDAAAHYRLMKEGGLAYGPRFRGVAEVHCGPRDALGRVRPLAELGLEGADHVVHPALWDAAHQVLAAVLARRDERSEPATWIPIGIDRVAVHGAPPASEPVWVHARAELGDDGATARGDVRILDRSGRLLAETRGLALLRRDADGLDDVGQWFLQPVLRAAPRPAAPVGDRTGSWIVIGAPDAPDSFRAQLLAELRGQGAEVVEAAEPEPLTRAIARVSAERTLRGALDLRPYQRARGGDVSGDALSIDAEALAAIYLDALDAARVLQGASRGGPPLQLVLVSGAAGAVPDLLAAPLQGLARVISTELPQLRCVQVQIGGRDLAAEARSLAHELAATDEEDEIVLRGSERHVRRLERVVPAPLATAAIRPDGTYLITGGLGGLGLVFARWLADRGATNLVLIGRRPPSPEARAQLDALVARGIDVLVREVDVAQPALVAALFGELDQRGLPLHGVLHLAGVLDDATLFQQDAERFARASGPKVIGTQLLHAHTRHRALDFFVLFSGGAALLGTPGQANYAAANAFLDAFAAHRRQLGLPALAIDWGIWDEVGLAAAAPQRGGRLQEQGLLPIRPALGLQAFERALSLACAEPARSNLAILPIRLARWLGHYPGLARSSLWKELARALAEPAGDAEASILDQLRATLDRREQGEQLRRWVERQLAAVLRRDPASLQRQQSFSAIGVDSLMALELRNRLERSLRVRLPPTMIFNHPNIEALGAFLEEKLELAPANGERPAAGAAAPLAEQDGAALLGALARLKRIGS